MPDAHKHLLEDIDGERIEGLAIEFAAKVPEKVLSSDYWIWPVKTNPRWNGVCLRGETLALGQVPIQASAHNIYFKKMPRKLDHLEIFDGASRGPLEPGNNCALVTILCLGLSPFAQQVVLIEQRAINTSDSTATFGYTHTYSQGSLQRWDPGMQTTIYQGLYRANTTKPFHCSGSSECNNVTEVTLEMASCETQGSVWSGPSFVMNAVAMQTQTTRIEDIPKIARFVIWRSTANEGFGIFNENVTECSLFLTAISFARRREVDSGVDNPWSADGTGLIDSLLSAIEYFFVSPSMSASWSVGDIRNRYLRVAAALSGNVDSAERFDKMAIAMTDYLRYASGSQTAQGELIESVPYVSIRWGYFVVPIVTGGFVILFAILSIINNRKSRNIPLWKSSTLAVLECRHEERLGLLQTTGKDSNQIDAEVQKAEVRLQ
ncbi:hypothetical protein BDW69DRAFT_203679 [Aspergillus filifer]